MKQDFYKDIANYLNRLQETIAKLNHDEINTFINLLIAARDEEKQIFIMGNGGSASTASHFCCDFNKGSSYGFDKRFKFICLNDNVPGMMAYANDVSYDDIFVEQLKNFFQPGDYVIGISGSGNSHNVIRAVEYAKEHGCKIIGLTGFSGGKLKELSDISLHAPVNSMQVTEDIHMIFDHLMMSIFYKYLCGKEHLQD